MEQNHFSDENSNSNQIGKDVCGAFISKNPLLIETEKSVVKDVLNIFKINESDEPIFPIFRTFEERLRTFKNWPHKSLNLAPDILSAAGLFYTGSKDTTRCFHCDGSLKNFEESDDPWVEHAYWFPKCRYVSSVRGEKFIEDIRKMRSQSLNRVREELSSGIETLKEIIVKNRHIAESVINSDFKNEMDESSDESISSSYKSRMMCLICVTEERNMALLPCYHIVACSRCASNLTKCCVCREPIIYRRPVYIP